MPALVAPVLALVVCALAISLAYRIVGRRHPGPVTRGFRLGQLVSGSLFSLSHGTNDAQKTMGIIVLALVSNGNLSAGADVPTWVVLSAATAIALGTYVGGWRIIKTMGSRIIKMDPAQGFASQTVGACVILSASHAGFPLSTTHVMTGGIMGAGAAKRLSAVRWGVAGNIAGAWVLTLPASAAVGGLTYAIVALFGAHEAGPIVVSLILLFALTAAFVKRIATGRTLDGGGLMLAAIDFHALGRVILASLVAGVGIPVLYSLAIFGVGKADEARRGGLNTAAAAYSALAIAALLVFGASVVLGVSVMLNKD